MKAQSGDTYIDWLVSKGCRFYAPMDYGNGLAELIQGWTPNINPNSNIGTCSFDAGMDAFYIDNSNAGYATLMYNGKTINSDYVGNYIPAIGLTAVFEINMVNDKAIYDFPLQLGGSDDFGCSGSGDGRKTFPIFSREIFERNGLTMNLSQWYTIVLRYDHGSNQCLYFSNGSLVTVENIINTTWTQKYTTYMNSHVSLCLECGCFFKNLYVFNVAVGDNDLLEIYRHDHQ